MSSNINPALASLVVDIDTLENMDSNPRLHDERSVEAIKGSYATFQQQKPIVLASDGKTVISGNGQLAAARALGWTKIAAIVSEMAGDKAKAFAIADNRTGDLSTFADDIVGDICKTLNGDLLTAAGFTQAELFRELDLIPDGEDAAAFGEATIVEDSDYSEDADTTAPVQAAAAQLEPDTEEAHQSFLVTGKQSQIVELRKRLNILREQQSVPDYITVLLKLTDGETTDDADE